MTVLQMNDPFPDVTLPNHEGNPIRLSTLTSAGEMDRHMGFADGYPLIVSFYRGFYCPRDQAQMRLLVQFQEELQVNYCQLVSISVQASPLQAAFRAGLGANWHFLADEERALIKQLQILDETEGEYAYPARPFTFVLRPDLTIYRIYDGWFFVGRPTLEELRQDLRAIMSQLSHYDYATYNTDEAKQVRIPQQVWAEGAPPLGASGLPVHEGIVTMFDLRSGNGRIRLNDSQEEVFFNFTAIPGAGYRTVAPGTAVRCELVTTSHGKLARNIQQLPK